MLSSVVITFLIPWLASLSPWAVVAIRILQVWFLALFWLGNRTSDTLQYSCLVNKTTLEYSYVSF